MATNPILAAVIQKLGAGGASGPGGQPTSDEGMGASQMAADLHGADPTFLLKSLQKIKQQLSQLFVQSSMRLPNVSGNIAKTMTTLDRAIKEAQQAAATQSVVRSPIGFGAAGGGADPGAGNPTPSLGIGGF